MTKLREQGFSVVELIIVIVVLAILGLTGWYVYSHHKTKSQAAKMSTSHQAASPPATNVALSVQLNTPAPGQNTYTDAGAKASFSYPSSWKLASFGGYCGNSASGGCSDVADGINSVQLTSPDSKVKLWWTGLSGVGGIGCDPTAAPSVASSASTLGACPLVIVSKATPIPKSAGLFVVEGIVEYDDADDLANNHNQIMYGPFLSVQDSSSDILKTGRQYPGYQSFVLPNSKPFIDDVFNLASINGKDPSLNPPVYSTLAEAQNVLTQPDVVQAESILLSLAVQ